MRHEQHNPQAVGAAHYQGKIGARILRTRTKRTIPAAAANDFRAARDAFDRM